MSKKKELLLSKVLELFATKGYQSTSMADICKAANVSKGLIYHHFKSKEAILIEVFTAETKKMTDMTIDATRDPKAQLSELIHNIFSSLARNKKRFQFNVNVMFQPATRQILEKQIKERASILFQQTKTIFDNISLESSTVLSYMFIAEIDGIVLNYLASFDNYPIKAVKANLLAKYEAL